MTTARNHPIHTWITKALKHRAPPYLSNLENLIKHHPKYVQPGMEHITAYARPPWWKLPATTAISPLNKDEAAEAHQQRLHQISTQDSANAIKSALQTELWSTWLSCKKIIGHTKFRNRWGADDSICRFRGAPNWAPCAALEIRSLTRDRLTYSSSNIAFCHTQIDVTFGLMKLYDAL